MDRMVRNFMVYLIIIYAKLLFSLTNRIGYTDGDAILLFHSGNMDYKHAIEIRRSLFRNTNKLVDKYNKEGKQYCTDYIMLEYL